MPPRRKFTPSPSPTWGEGRGEGPCRLSALTRFPKPCEGARLRKPASPLQGEWKRLAVLLLLCLLAAPAYATPQEELEQTRKEMQLAEQRRHTLAEKEKQLSEELKTLQDRLVKTAAAAQKTEFQLSDSEDKLRILGEQVKSKEEALKAQKQRLSHLIMAELSLSRTPPEAMLMMPEDPVDILKAARALSMASESIRAQTQALADQLGELGALKAKMTERRDQLAAMQATLDAQRRQLISQLEDRTALQNQLGKQQQQAEETVNKLARKSADLKELVSGIEQEEEAKKHKPSAETDAAHLRSFEDARGHIRPSAAGQLVQKFGVSQGRNATSKGITIATRARAQVTAPYDGEVVFTGPFLNYGRMIIIRHSDDFHTLLAGLAKIDAVVGQFLLEGEPIGAMGEGDDEHTLYIELRKENQPVDPALWISGLNKKK